MEQQNIFEVDMVGRKAARLGLPPQNEIIVELLDAGKRFYDICQLRAAGIEMVGELQLSGSAKAEKLESIFTAYFEARARYGDLLVKWTPVDREINAEIDREVALERRAFAERQTSAKMDAAFSEAFGPTDPTNVAGSDGWPLGENQPENPTDEAEAA